jgi:hypothetical protein
MSLNQKAPAYQLELYFKLDKTYAFLGLPAGYPSGPGRRLSISSGLNSHVFVPAIWYPTPKRSCLSLAIARILRGLMF